MYMLGEFWSYSELEPCCVQYFLIYYLFIQMKNPREGRIIFLK